MRTDCHYFNQSCTTKLKWEYIIFSTSDVRVVGCVMSCALCPGPQREEVDECRVQVSPPGFHVVPLPFMEDLRQLQYDDTPKGVTLGDISF